MEVVSTKHFCHDLQCGGVVNAAWVGLLREAEGTCASASGGDGDVAGATAPPADFSQLRSFLGCCNFYERFVKYYAEIAAPLTDLLGSKVQWVWGAAEQTAFDTLKQALCIASVLLMPDLRGDFVVDTDASQRSIGGVI